jgi:hypothetical protein
MKRLLLLITMCMSLSTITIAAPWDIKSPSPKSFIWNPASNQKVVADPEIVELYVVKDGDEIHFNVILSGAVERNMVAHVWIRTYRNYGIPQTWGWVWIEHIIEMPYDGSSNHYGESFFSGLNWQYEGHAGSGNTIIVNQDQLNVSYYGPQ